MTSMGMTGLMATAAQERKTPQLTSLQVMLMRLAPLLELIFHSATTICLEIKQKSHSQITHSRLNL